MIKVYDGNCTTNIARYALNPLDRVNNRLVVTAILSISIIVLLEYNPRYLLRCATIENTRYTIPRTKYGYINMRIIIRKQWHIYNIMYIISCV